MQEYLIVVEPEDAEEIKKVLKLKFSHNLSPTMVSNVWTIKTDKELDEFEVLIKSILGMVKKETYIFIEHTNDYRSFSVGEISKRL